jgi:type IV pilus assembly protein PilA
MFLKYPNLAAVRENGRCFTSFRWRPRAKHFPLKDVLPRWFSARLGSDSANAGKRLSQAGRLCPLLWPERFSSDFSRKRDDAGELSPSRKAAPAFSLVELLVVIAVIAVIAAIAIPNIANIVRGANDSRDLRNAQALAEMASAARGAGHPGWPTKSDAITELVAGIQVTNPVDQTIVIHFRVDTVSPENQAKASVYLTSDGKSLIYVPSGGQPTN